MGQIMSLEAQWETVSNALKRELGDDIWNSWIKPLNIVSAAEGQLQLAAPSRFARDWVSPRYGELIKSLWGQQDPSVKNIDIIVASLSAPVAPVVAKPVLEEEPVSTPAPYKSYTETTSRYAASDEVDLPKEPSAEVSASARLNTTMEEDLLAALDPRFTFDNFVVGKPNELAHAAARRVADQKEVTFNPLFLYGGVGLGKTHLMHAIAWQIYRNNPKRKVLYLSAEKFMYKFIRALRFKDTMAFKEQFRSVDVLMIDDVQFISGKDNTQEEFFHTFNALVDQNRQVIISADKSPSDLEGMEERLRSRLGWGLVADIHPTNYELRLGILQAKADQMGIKIDPRVLEFLSHKITSNVREMEGALNRIAAHADLVGRDITIETAQECLSDLIRANDRRITIDEIQTKVAEHFNIRVADMHSARRARTVARPRQVAMFLAKQLTQRSLPEIGRKFGGRDHTTVMHAVRKVEELCKSDPSFSEDVNLLRRMLEN